jgi:hypothetical protein
VGKGVIYGVENDPLWIPLEGDEEIIFRGWDFTHNEGRLELGISPPMIPPRGDDS